MDLDPARIHGHGPRCPCDHCAWQMRHATAAYRLARNLAAAYHPHRENAP